MTYDPRAAYLARINATASQEDGLVKENDENVVAGTAPESEQTVVDATDKTEVEKLATETGAGTTSQEEISSLPEQKEGSDNIAETEKGNKVSTIDPEMPTDAEDFPESPVEAYDSSETPEKLAAGVVSSVKTLEEGVTQVENDISAVRELENVATEMRAIIAAKGAMTSAEARMVQVAVDNALRKTGVVADMASMEAFDATGTASYATDVSLEGVGDAIASVAEKMAHRILEGFNNIAGLAKSLTPLLDRNLKRAQAVLGQINNSHRESGLKTIVDDDLCSDLILDGKVPEAATVLKTAQYLQTITDELFSGSDQKLAEEYLSLANKAAVAAQKETDYPFKDIPLLLLFAPVIGAAAQGTVNKSAVRLTKVPSNGLPKLSSVFPSISKANHPLDGKNTANLIAHRSLPLFGNQHIIVTDFKPTVDVTIKEKAFPSITIKTTNDNWSGNEIQTLTSNQQADLMKIVIAILGKLITHYRTFGRRNEVMRKAYDKALESAFNVKEERKDAVPRVAVYVIRNLAHRLAIGLYGDQGKIAKAFAYNCDSLINYAEKSRKATQADDKDPAKAAENRAAVED